MSKKKVTAPLSYNPGKGRPKEHLAYLNWQEMQALKRLNGNNQERGPMGLPSFPPADAKGSSSKASSSKSSTKSTGSGSIGSKGGGASTQRPGAGVGSKSAGTVSKSGGSSVGSRQGGGGSGSIGSKGGGASTQRAGAGKGMAKSGEVSQARNEAQKGSLAADRARASKESGIKSLSVGPMGTRVNVSTKAPGSQIKGAVRAVQETAAQAAARERAGPFGAPAYGGVYNPKTGKFDGRPVADTTVKKGISAIQSPVIAPNPYDVTIERQKYREALQSPVIARNPYDVTIERQKYNAALQSPVIARNPYEATIERQRYWDAYNRPVMARNPYDTAIERQAAKIPNEPASEVDLTQDAYNRAAQMGNVMRYGYPVDVRKETLARINDIRAQLGPTTQTYPGADGVTDQDIGGVFGNAPKTRSITPAGAETVLSVEDVPESVMAGEAQSLADLKKAAKAAGFPPALYNDPAFLRDESRLGLMASQQTDVGPTDMAKLHSRSYGEGYTTPEEKRRGAVISGIERIVNRTVPGQLAVKGFKEYADIESPKEFLSRPAYEQSYLRD
jgi:hypothetical protein